MGFATRQGNLLHRDEGRPRDLKTRRRRIAIGLVALQALILPAPQAADASSGAASPNPPPLPPPRPALAAPAPAPTPVPLATDVPLPPVRPAEFGHAPPIAPPPPFAPTIAPPPALPPLLPPVPSGTAMQDTMDAACARILASGKVRASRVPAVIGPNGCGIAFPVALGAIVLKDGRTVEVRPSALMRCDLAEALADWVRDDLAPLGAERGGLVGIDDAAAYDCRSRNHVPGATLSEHGRGDAIDVVALRFATATVGLRQDDAHPLWSQVKASACARFMTVLGPGSDGYHEDNLHLDLENRHHGSHYCHWDHP